MELNVGLVRNSKKPKFDHLKEKMKGVLNAEQYAKYSQMQERRIKRIQRNRKKRR